MMKCVKLSVVALLVCVGVVGTPSARAQEAVWKQSPEIQTAIARGTDDGGEPAKELSISDAQFNQGPTPDWIWGADDNKNYVLSTRFEVNGVKSARLKASCDNVGTVYVNGKQVASSNEWSEPMAVDVTDKLVAGENVIEAQVANQGGVAAFVLKLAIEDQQGKIHYVVSNVADWRVADRRGQAGEVKPARRGTLGDGPWQNVFDNSSGLASRVPRGVFETLPGFQVEKLFTVPKDELGSWIGITTDDKGRLLVSDQGNLGICRIVPAPPGMKQETRVERLDFSKCEYQPTGAQGMLFAFGSLYLSINGGPGSGLYRARDTNGDDQFDECVKLHAFRGGGEHGPHSLRLSPDGKRIFVIAGNHTDPPFRAGEDLTHESFSSRIPTNWGEDLLLPRMWDANGHARGKLAPGGWIASTDPEGKSWQIWSIGYRNPYDMAFNADGELFAYDADMEWDVGAPWYRPTRVVHATSGSEFGWRSGTGKWPTYYLDSLPPLVDIGPGSPVGVEFGYGLKFPAKYQKALFLCDWTFGTMYAVHLTPYGSSYTATKEEFLSRSPLPLTDVVAGTDGAMYFTIGGRGTQSELYRVTYVGKESTAPARLQNPEFAESRALRRSVEELHGRAATAGDLERVLPRSIGSGELRNDRALRFSVRNARQNPERVPELLNELAVRTSLGANEATRVIDSATALARIHDRSDSAAKTRGNARETVIGRLLQVAYGKLDEAEQLDYLRALSLVMIRLGEPSERERLSLLNLLDEAFPSSSDAVSRELCQVLVYLKSPTVVGKTVALLGKPPQRREIDLTYLLARNPGYGRAINAMIANQPDQQQVSYAFTLRNVKKGWSPKQREAYFRWFTQAYKWSGGNSFRKFLQNIDEEAFLGATENERVLIEASGARQPFQAPKLLQPTGPGKDWQLAEVRALAQTELKQRDFENGRKMFAVTRCILCHRFNGDGGATGPDLTHLAGRFNVKDLTEAIMEPSKVISDQYVASIIVTASGKTINGRVVSENDDQISVLTDPEDSTKVIDIKRGDIDEIAHSKTSIMPKDLLKPLNQDEVLDLLAYLLSRGDKGHAMFRK